MVHKRLSGNKNLRAFIIGVALGDGNLSNPNGRAARLRVTCDRHYPRLTQMIVHSIEQLLPDNKISFIRRGRFYGDVSSFSNYWEKLLEWRVGYGSKIKQNVSVPRWIKKIDAISKPVSAVSSKPMVLSTKTAAIS